VYKEHYTEKLSSMNPTQCCGYYSSWN